MKIKHIKLIGCIGIQKGLGLEEIEINFDNFNPGLIGLFGKSGSGKSTILNNLNPYRTDFKSNFYDDGTRELKFIFKEHEYLSQVYHEKAFLFKDGKLLNESGKVSTYDESLENEIGDQNVFYKMLYAGRRFKNILELTKGEKKQLVIDYLLDYLKDYETYGKQLKEEQQSLEKDLLRLKVKLEEEETIKEEIEKYKTDGKETVEKIKEIEEKIEKLKKKQLLWEEENEENEKINKQIDKLETESEEKFKLCNINLKEQGNKQQEINDLNEKIEETEEKIDKIEEVNYNIDDLEKNKTNLEEQQEEIETLDKELKNTVKQSEREVKEYNRISEELDELKKELEDLENQNPPCTKDLQLKCPLTKNTDYSEVLKKFNLKIEKKEKELKEQGDISNGVKREILVITEKQEKLNEKEIDYDSEISKINKKIKKQKEFNEIKGFVELNKERKDTIKKYEKQRDEYRELYEKYLRETKKVENEIENLKKEIKNEYTDYSDDIKEKEEKLIQLKTTKENLKKQLTEKKEKLETFGKIKDKIEKIETEIIEYNLLIEFFGKTGGVLFDIEMAGEQISNIANKLLENYSNKQIKIKFETLKTDSKGQPKEVFDIACSINGEDWQTYLSDGESVLVSNSIREAMSYLRKQREYKTVFIDELDGSIDSENRIGFLKLLEQGNELNNRDFTFLISHSEEVKGHLEQSIELKDGTINLNY